MARPTPNRVTITVDGREIETDEGVMLIDAAKDGDVEIPFFCYDPKLGDPVGACRMCLVEIEGIPKLQTSCSTPVRDGMVIHTQTEQVKEAQNAVVEFLLVNHPLDCPVCDKGGECPLQDISMGWGPDRNRFVDNKRHFEKPVPLSPLIAIDRERCILCYRCVRFSQEVAEDSQLQLLERGDRTIVGTFDERPYIAPFTGNITELCPVGALTSYTYRFQARPWDIEQGGSVCTLCPSQCNVSFTVRDEQVKRVLDRENPEVDDGWLCDKGRYGFQAMYSPDRVLNPVLQSEGQAIPSEWTEAIQIAVAGLAESGPATAALVGDASNEEGYLVQLILREVLGSADIDSRQAPGIDRAQAIDLFAPEMAARTSDIDTADLVLRVEAGEEEGLAGLVREAADVVIIWGERIGRGEHGAEALDALAKLARAAGLDGSDESGLIAIPDVANGRGLREVGCLPDAGPGLTPVDAGRDVEAIREGLESGEIKSLVLFGVDPLRDLPDTEGWRRALEAAEHVVAFSLTANDSTEFADVLFPLESHAEKDATVTHPDGRIQRVRPSARRPGEIKAGWLVLAEIAAELGFETGIDSAASALAEVADAVPFYAGLTDAEIGGRGVRWQDRPAADRFGESSPASEGAATLSPATGNGSGPARNGAAGPADGGLVLGTYRDLWADPTTDLSPALNFLIPAQRLEISGADAARLGLSTGDEVSVRAGDRAVNARVAVRGGLDEGICFMIEGTRAENANALTEGDPVAVEVGPPEIRVELVTAGAPAADSGEANTEAGPGEES